MAVYHCSVAIISRGDGRSAVAAAAIRAAELERQGIATERGDPLCDTEEYNALTQQLYALHDRLEALQAQSDPASAAGQS